MQPNESCPVCQCFGFGGFLPLKLNEFVKTYQHQVQFLLYWSKTGVTCSRICKDSRLLPGPIQQVFSRLKLLHVMAS